MKKIDYKLIKKEKDYVTIQCGICQKIKRIPQIRFIYGDFNHNAHTCEEHFYRNKIGEIYGDYKIIDYRRNVEGQRRIRIKCQKCGIEEEINYASFQAAKDKEKVYKHGTRCLKLLPNDEFKKVFIERYYNMYQRCNNPNNTNYEHYGGRGIKLEYESAIDLYFDFIDEFKELAITNPINIISFDRIDVNGNYCKSNLRLVCSQSIQSTNTTRKRIFILAKGKEKVIADSAMEVGRHYNINGRAIGNLVRGTSKTSFGWTLAKIVDEDEDIGEVIKQEGVTTNLIIS